MCYRQSFSVWGCIGKSNIAPCSMSRMYQISKNMTNHDIMILVFFKRFAVPILFFFQIFLLLRHVLVFHQRIYFHLNVFVGQWPIVFI